MLEMLYLNTMYLLLAVFLLRCKIHMNYFYRELFLLSVSAIVIFVGGFEMSRQGLFDEPFAAEEDLFFHKLFSEDEFSQNRASKMTSSYVDLSATAVPAYFLN